LIFESRKERSELRLHLANFGLLFFAALGSQLRLFAIEFLLASFYADALGF